MSVQIKQDDIIQTSRSRIVEMVSRAVEAEREACALICDEHADDPVYCGEAIRARSES